MTYFNYILIEHLTLAELRALAKVQLWIEARHGDEGPTPAELARSSTEISLANPHEIFSGGACVLAYVQAWVDYAYHELLGGGRHEASLMAYEAGVNLNWLLNMSHDNEACYQYILNNSTNDNLADELKGTRFEEYAKFKRWEDYTNE